MSAYASAEDEGVTINPFTQYLPDASRLRERESALRENFSRNKLTGKVDGTFEMRVLSVVRLIATPKRYVEFGPYWWAVKAALNSRGDDLGDAMDARLASVYVGQNDVATFIAACDFAEFYRGRFFAGTRVFDLGDLGADGYEVTDEDMDAMSPA